MRCGKGGGETWYLVLLGTGSALSPIFLRLEILRLLPWDGFCEADGGEREEMGRKAGRVLLSRGDPAVCGKEMWL